MKRIYFLFAITWAGCYAGEQQNQTTVQPDTVKVQDVIIVKKEETDKPASPAPAAQVFSNERFKDVVVEKIGEHQFLIRGKGQIFEASFNWVIEDGHEELKSGYQMTDAGAPEWGNFSFTVDVQKKRANSTLFLILFESSAKDGSRQYELPVFLY